MVLKLKKLGFPSDSQSLTLLTAGVCCCRLSTDDSVGAASLSFRIDGRASTSPPLITLFSPVSFFGQLGHDLDPRCSELASLPLVLSSRLRSPSLRPGNYFRPLTPLVSRQQPCSPSGLTEVTRFPLHHVRPFLSSLSCNHRAKAIRCCPGSG